MEVHPKAEGGAGPHEIAAGNWKVASVVHSKEKRRLRQEQDWRGGQYRAHDQSCLYAVSDEQPVE
jgi:hypothetical protein